MLEKVKAYFEMEYEETKALLEREDRPWWVDPNEQIDKSIQRCLGVTQFIQTVGVTYEDLNCYDEIRERFEKLRKTIDN